MEVVEHETKMSAELSFLDGFKEAKEEDKWMAAVWCVKDGKIHLVRVSTWQFPTGDFDGAVRLLRNHCDQRSGMVLPTDPLPKANLDQHPIIPEL